MSGKKCLIRGFANHGRYEEGSPIKELRPGTGTAIVQILLANFPLLLVQEAKDRSCTAEQEVSQTICGLFLESKYPKEVMMVVDKISAEGAAEHREKNIAKLQGIFVKASDATETEGESSNVNQSSDPERAPCNTEVVVPQTNSPFGRIVLFHFEADTNPKAIVKTSLARNKIKKRFGMDFSFKEKKWICTLTIDKVELSVGKNEDKKEAEAAAFLEGYRKLSLDCYTIKVTGRDVESETKNKLKIQRMEIISEDTKSTQDSVAVSLMKKMGWSGGGLGKNEQGIKEPIEVSKKITRSGLGSLVPKRKVSKKERRAALESLDSNVQIEKLKMLLNEFETGSDRMIVFSPDLLSEERALIHQYAQKNGFTTKSFGENESRYLTISKRSQTPRLDPWKFVQALYTVEGKESSLDSSHHIFKLIMPSSLYLQNSYSSDESNCGDL